ncbi:MAG: carboxypeptidase-like regulatory domain-containing protein, partial [Paramuribaculum sp.]|nr:carboxypeptidase-like regulatory domain-containing protein [Paramuribaculum sp.]
MPSRFSISFLALFFLLFFSIFTSAGESPLSDANVFGHVVEAGTGEHLAGVTVRLIGTNYGATTDASGHYSIRNIAPGKYKLEAHCAGYADKRESIVVEQNKTLEINFEIAPDALMLDQVVVTGNRSEVRRSNSSSLIGIIGAPMFRMINSSSLADGLCYQPGVRVENDCQNCGFTQVRINGLDGHYSQILMNSRP